MEIMAFSYEGQLLIFLISSRGEPIVDGPQNEGCAKGQLFLASGINMLENGLQNLGIGQFFGKTQ
jgi:hypothetical protein